MHVVELHFGSYDLCFLKVVFILVTEASRWFLLQVRTEGEAPSAPPTGVRADALSPTSLRVMWDPPPTHAHHGDLLGYNVGVRRHEYEILHCHKR